MLGRVVETDPRQAGSFAEKNSTKATMSFGRVPLSFRGMMTKIGCGQALTKLDLDDFKPLVPPYTLGMESNISHVVGCKDEIEPQEEGLGCRMSTLVSVVADRGYIISEVRLAANCDSPTYVVVFGQTIGIKATRTIRSGPGAAGYACPARRDRGSEIVCRGCRR